MTIKSLVERVNLKLILEDGTKEDGSPIFKAKTYNRIKAEATDTKLYEVGSVLGDFQTKPLESIVKVEESSLYQD